MHHSSKPGNTPARARPPFYSRTRARVTAFMSPPSAPGLPACPEPPSTECCADALRKWV